MAQKYKVGDVLVPKDRTECGSYGASSKAHHIRITELYSSNRYYYDIEDVNNNVVDSCGVCFKDSDLVLLTLTNTKNSIMTNITTFVKNLALSANEKALRKVGLKTECGDYTQAAIDVVLQDLCTEREARLVEIANGIISEEAK